MLSRKVGILVTSVLFLGGMSITSTPAWADEGDRDFTLTVKVTDVQKEDNGERGPSVGDRVLFAANLFEGGDDVGNGHGTCVVSEAHRDRRDSVSLCHVTFELRDGNLDMEGSITGDELRDGQFDLPVEGGSGEFRDADGDATFTRVDDGHHRDYRSQAVNTSQPYNDEPEKAWRDKDESDKEKGDRERAGKDEGGRNEERAGKDEGNRDEERAGKDEGDRGEERAGKGNRDEQADRERGDRNDHDGNRDHYRSCGRNYDWRCYDRRYPDYDRGYRDYDGRYRDRDRLPVFVVVVDLR